MLELKGLTAGYGREAVLRDVNLTVHAGEIVTLIGANGAGKSTLVKAVSGLLRPLAGHVVFDGRPLDTLSPGERVKLGIVHVPEGRQVFSGMTTEENLVIGAYAHRHRLSKTELKARLDEVYDLFPVLGSRRNDIVGNFSGGQQQMLAIGRGLMSQPRLIILDEPSLGLALLLVEKIFRLVEELRRRGISVLLSEQNARSALGIADRAYVLDGGKIAEQGNAADLLNSPAIAERYLGVGSATAFSAEHSASLATRLRAIGEHLRSA